MNYRVLLCNTFKVFRESRLVWFLGAIFFVSEFILKISVYSLGNPPVPCIAYPLFFISLYFSFMAKSSLIYSTSQIASAQEPTNTEAWELGKLKFRKILGLYFLGVPLVMFSVFIVVLVVLSELNTFLTLAVYLLITFFLGSLFTLSICSIVIRNLEPGLALWTGLSMVVNNFIHIIVVNGIFLALQILLNLSIGNGFFGIFFIVPLTVAMTLAYQEFIKKDSYPALSNI
jgi:hypothetical protein